MPSGEARSTSRLQVSGDDPAEAFVAAYEELRHVASALLCRERPHHTLQTTALLHEAFLRLVRAGDLTVENRREYIRLIAVMMRRVLVDYARTRNASKRGGQYRRVNLAVADLPHSLDGGSPIELVLGVNRALQRLAEIDPFKAEVVELRFFGGFTVREAAEILATSTSTIERSWRSARAWLFRALRADA